eukprot:TRINITY_DN858_c0_g1_i1.p1 TRINITY_DN858_c0_g1~~TRINITY_DN858_c0_g1_i1.p1  ORF type:complete len:357 (+),score=50.67 TRINITY_DN858_c0_g1_i1:270-1340(+)
MDGLLGSEFALVLRDSVNATPRRRQLPPLAQRPLPPPSLIQPCSPPKKPRHQATVLPSVSAGLSPSSRSTFSLRCDMQLEPRANFAPFPTSPTSPLPPPSVQLPFIVGARTPPPTAPTAPAVPSAPLASAPATAAPTTPTASVATASSGGSYVRTRDSSALSVRQLTICKSRRAGGTDGSDKLASYVLMSPTSSPPLSPLMRSATRMTVSPTQRLDVLAAVSVQTAGELAAAAATATNSSTASTSTITTSTSGGRKKKSHRGSNGGRAKSFACSQCSSTFSQQFNLNKHVRAVHERRRPFECSVCHARFQQKSHRTMHFLAVHEKLRQFSCDQCNASFSWRGVLKKHRKSIHGICE